MPESLEIKIAIEVGEGDARHRHVFTMSHPFGEITRVTPDEWRKLSESERHEIVVAELSKRLQMKWYFTP